jgi:hypothetical protein
MPTLTGSLSTSIAGSGASYFDTLTVTGDGLYGQLSSVSSSLTRFKDGSGNTLDIAFSYCHITITPSPNAHAITYSFIASSPIGAYDTDTIPSTIKIVPRGSSDLVLPSTVITTNSFTSINTNSYQIFSYALGATKVYAEFTIVVNQTVINVGQYTFTATQEIDSAGYRGFSGTNSLDLKQYR